MNPITPNPWVILGGVLLVLAALVSVGIWQRGEGRDLERADCVDRENKELVAANAEILRLHDDVVEQEKRHLVALDVIAIDHQKEIAKNENQKQRDVADARSGALGLRFHATCPRTDTGQGSEAGTATSIGDGRTEVELSPETVDALYQIVNDADRNTDQLREAQAVIREDRRLCGAAITSPNHD